MFIPNKMKRILLTACAALLATSCMMDKKPGVPVGPGEGKVAVTFAVEVPAAVPVQTRAAYGDCDVLNMDVLVFDQNGKFLERAGTDLVSGDGAAKSFTVRVDPSIERRTFMVIANARTQAGAERVDMTALAPGMSETDVLEVLRTVPLVGGRADEILPLVMYGHGELPKVDDAAGPLNVSLLRAAACIQVKTATPTSDNGLADFRVLRGTLSRAAAFGRVSGSRPLNDLTYVNYWSSETDDAGWSIGANPVLYAYESRASTSQNVSVLVKASWKGRECYYRLWVTKQQPDGSVSYYHIGRNRRYTLMIRKVEGPGWETPELAMANAPANEVNLQVLITETSDDIFDIVADDQYMLGLTCNSLERWGRSEYASSRTQLFKFLRATHPSAATLLEADIAVEGVTDVTFAPTLGLSDGYFNVLYSRGVTDYDCTGSITFRCGPLERRVETNFRETKFLTGYADKDGDSYVFLIADETTPKPWRVWIPESKTMRLSSSASAADFTPAAGGDNSGWGAGLMESRTAAKAYLHIPARTNSCAEEYLMLTDGNGLVRRITIGKHD